MKSRPIMFSTPMIQALSHKSQTRRTRGLERINQNPEGWKLDTMINGSTACFLPVNSNDPVDVVFIKCPYGVKGDRLWVRETWRPYSEDKVRIEYKADGVIIDYPEQPDFFFYACGDKWRSAMFMFRWMSRHLLELVEEPIPQRLWDITEQDAIVEGAPAGYIEASPTIFDRYSPDYKETLKDYRAGFARLWDSINRKKYPWSGNYWDWKLVFREIKQ